MVWSTWKSSLGVMLLCSGLAWSQQSTTLPTTPAGARHYISINEPGKPAEKCEVIRCWLTESGEKAIQVLGTVSGDRIVVLDPPPADGQPVARKIYRVSNSGPIPEGFPTAPADGSRDCDCFSGVVLAQNQRIEPVPQAIPQQPVTTISEEPIIVSEEGPFVPNCCPEGGMPVRPTPLFPRLMRHRNQVSEPVIISENVVESNPPALAEIAGNPGTTVQNETLGSRIKEKITAFLNKPNQKPVETPTPDLRQSWGGDSKTMVAKNSGKDQPLPPPASRTEKSEKKDPLTNLEAIAPPEVKSKIETTSIPHRPAGTPPGSQSVISANNGLKTPVKYVPYPVVTMPSPSVPPGPPPPQIPQPPQPGMYVNAFTPTQQQGQQYQQHPGYGMQGYPYPPQMRYPMPYPQQMPQGQYPQGFAQNGPVGTPSNPTNVARNYQGPGAPNPFGNFQQQQQISPVAYQQQYYQQYQTQRPNSYYGNMPNSGQNVVYQLVTTLRTAVSPAQREWAAMCLVSYDWQRNPVIVDSLVAAAKDDPAATVRAGCVNCLARMNLGQERLGVHLAQLQNDSDARVREAIRAVLGESTDIQQTSGNASVPQQAPAIPH